jgi:hypothetical protein
MSAFSLYLASDHATLACDSYAEAEGKPGRIAKAYTAPHLNMVLAVHGYAGLGIITFGHVLQRTDLRNFDDACRHLPELCRTTEPDFLEQVALDDAQTAFILVGYSKVSQAVQAYRLDSWQNWQLNELPQDYSKTGPEDLDISFPNRKPTEQERHLQTIKAIAKRDDQVGGNVYMYTVEKDKITAENIGQAYRNVAPHFTFNL